MGQGTLPVVLILSVLGLIFGWSLVTMSRQKAVILSRKIAAYAIRDGNAASVELVNQLVASQIITGTIDPVTKVTTWQAKPPAKGANWVMTGGATLKSGKNPVATVVVSQCDGNLLPPNLPHSAFKDSLRNTLGSCAGRNYTVTFVDAGNDGFLELTARSNDEPPTPVPSFAFQVKTDLNLPSSESGDYSLDWFFKTHNWTCNPPYCDPARRLEEKWLLGREGSYILFPAGGQALLSFSPGGGVDPNTIGGPLDPQQLRYTLPIAFYNDPKLILGATK